MPLMEKAYKSYGSVFTVPLFHKRMTFLIGPEVSSHFFKVRLPPLLVPPHVWATHCQ